MLALAGVSHKTAPLEVRERLALDASELTDLLPTLRQEFGPLIVLSTCNRTEIYASGAEAVDRAPAIAARIATRRGVAGPVDEDHVYTLAGAGAVRHLYRVAAGLESMVVGETQISGQVRRALHVAQRAGAADGLLIRLFQTAVSASRRLRSGDAAVQSAASVSSAAVELAGSLVGDLQDRSVLVVSAGEAASLTARSLRQHGVRRVVVASRTLARAQKLAAELNVAAASLHELPRLVREADVVISATAARGFQIDQRTVAAAMAARPQRPLLLLDLAVPRDIDPRAGTVPNVVVHDMDSLQPLLGADAMGGSTAEAIEAALDGEVAAFMAWWQARWVVPTISALRGRAETIRRAELTKTLGRLPDLSADERQRIDALTTAIVNKLLHQPIMCLKESEGAPAYLDAVRELFALPLAAE